MDFADSWFQVPAGVGTSYLEAKGSKFFGRMWQVSGETELPLRLKEMRSLHKGIGHVAYAAVWDMQGIAHVHSDDGEPSGTAGKPIMNFIKGKSIRLVLVAVGRVYGGVPLGKGGLVKAYGTAGLMAIEDGGLQKKVLVQEEHLCVPPAVYPWVAHQFQQYGWLFRARFEAKEVLLWVEVPLPGLQVFWAWMERESWRWGI